MRWVSGKRGMGGSEVNVTRRIGLLVIVVLGVPLALAGCTSTPAKEAARRASPAPPPPPQLTITPAVNAANVPVSTEIGTAVTGGKITSVVLTDAKGGRVNGAMREDGTSWVPNTSLKHKQSY